MASEPASNGAREREWLKYFDPYQNIKGGQDKRRRWSSSQDKSLSVFAQLGALRLNARRAVISFFDRKHQYVLAEASRTLSLRRNEPSDAEDAFWLGSCILRRPATLCEHTLAKAEGHDGRHDTEAEVDIVADAATYTTLHSSYTQAPPPNFCFYAGVPIRTPNGVVIGTYSIFGDVERHGLSDDEMALMRELADVVMEHMDMVRSKEEHQRASKMVLGLGNFIDGKASLYSPHNADDPDNPEDLNAADKGDQAMRMEQSTENSENSESPESSYRELDKTDSGPRLSNLEVVHAAEVNPDYVPRVGEKSHQEATKSETPQRQPAGSIGSAGTDGLRDPLTSTSRDTSAIDLQTRMLSDNVQLAFSRAANVIRTTIDVEGSVFFDASVGVFGGSIDRHHQEIHGGEHGSTTSTASQDDAAADFKPAGTSSKRCGILGCSTSDYSSLSSHNTPDLDLTEDFLHALLKRHPRGKIFNFDPDEQNPQSDDSEGQPGVPDSFGQQVFPPDPPYALEKERNSARQLREEELRTFRQIFPDACSLAFVPIWDNHRNRWFAGGIAWSTRATRLLHMDSELSFLVAFGHSIMSEVARLDTDMADKAKGDLLGSISHELRSPLHGILGSIECLEDAQLDSYQSSLVSTIEICGRTLLDTVDHLLDFTKINSKPSRILSRSEVNSQSTPSGDLTSLNAGVDLAVLAEETMEAVFAGYDFMDTSDGNRPSQKDANLSPRRRTESAINPKVAIVLDIEKPTQPGWVMATEVGAWRRIMMNLCGNAIKYTREGYVRVGLQARPVDKERNTSEIILTIIDSGKGMSKEYLENQLFTPFIQEDPLLPGTGLGLSIIKKIIDGMNGTISIASIATRGTEVCVRVVMPHATQGDHVHKALLTSTVTDELKGANIVFFATPEDARLDILSPKTLERTKEDTAYVFLFSLCNTLRDWFGVSLSVVSTLEALNNADLIFTTDTKVEELRSLLLESSISSRILVLCENSVKTQRPITLDLLQVDGSSIVSIPQLYGPRKLARALEILFERRDVAPPEGQVISQHEETRDVAVQVGNSSVPLDVSTKPQANFAQPVVATMSNQNELPLEDKPNLPIQSSSAPPKPNIGKLKLLLVDDNNVNLQLLVRFVKSQKHESVSAKDGVEAVEAYKAGTPATDTSASRMSAEKAVDALQDRQETIENPSLNGFDFILMDISMPRMDGLEATRQIRTYERTHGIKSTTVIALTGLGGLEHQQEAYSSGVDMFLTKPVRLKELKCILEGDG